LPEIDLNTEQLLARFTEQLTAQEGIVHYLSDEQAFWERMDTLFDNHTADCAMATADPLLGLNLSQWGQSKGIEIKTPAVYPGRAGYTQAVFDKVPIGITTADYAVAESGTLVLVHGKEQARLVSLAPLIHVALLPRRRIVPTYEDALQPIFAQGRPPSQVCLITGPSMTADIQGVPFKGMHGPQKLIVLILEFR
jgi:L-lactate dehydrogenase complex protein LldG